MDSLKSFFQSAFPNKFYVPVIVLFLLIVVLALSFAKTEWKAHRPNFVLGIIISTLLLIIMAVHISNRWFWIVGLLPALLVGYQAFFLWLYQPKEVDGRGLPARADDDMLKLARERAQNTIASHFGLKTLFIRYGFPAALLGITGIVVLNVLTRPGDFFSLIRFINEGESVRVMATTANKVLLGLRLGAVGAYIYVLLELGRRTFRHDVTGASAMWCLVTFILGPVLAATVAVLWRIDTPQDNNWWAGGVVLFFAGFAPRRVIAAVEQAAMQLLKVSSSGVAPTRQIPLSQIRGIGPQIEERLSEEGIDDVNALAAAEPVRLVRNTSFDLRQILTWIDEAILITTLPKSWEALEEEGITGAIDLAWYHYELMPLAPGMREAAVRDLADKAKILPANLVATIRRLHDDRQLQDIWALYNNFTEYSGGLKGTGEGKPKEPEQQPIEATS